MALTAFSAPADVLLLCAGAQGLKLQLKFGPVQVHKKNFLLDKHSALQRPVVMHKCQTKGSEVTRLCGFRN